MLLTLNYHRSVLLLIFINLSSLISLTNSIIFHFTDDIRRIIIFVYWKRAKFYPPVKWKQLLPRCLSSRLWVTFWDVNFRNWTIKQKASLIRRLSFLNYWKGFSPLGDDPGGIIRQHINHLHKGFNRTPFLAEIWDELILEHRHGLPLKIEDSYFEKQRKLATFTELLSRKSL